MSEAASAGTGFLIALLISAVTTPVGVSGAVFLLPAQVSILGVPNPAVTPTNLMFNVIAAPAAVLRYWRAGQLSGDLVRRLLVGTVPGVVAGAVVRVYLIPGPTAIRLVMAVVLLPLGCWLIARAVRPARQVRRLGPAKLTAIAAVVGIVGGVYGIGGGSILGPILVGTGIAVAVAAPAAITVTLVTSVVGVAVFAVLALTHGGDIAPVWSVGLACGLGGVVGSYLGASLQPRVPERALRLLLGVLAVAMSVVYLAAAL